MTRESARRVLEKRFPFVKFLHPESTFIEEGGVAIAAGTVVYPNVVICGDVSIGNDCVIKAGTVLENCTVGHQCMVGPFAYIREGSVLEDDVRVGSHAEVNRSLLASGVRMDHHGYLGDAFVGESTTIGAGAVTANYDGERKNRTIINRNTLIGVNAVLIAKCPHLFIGSNVIVSAGSVITDDVPSDHTAFCRTQHQVNKGRK